MLKICNLTPKHFHPIRYYRYDKEATLISHYSERLGIAFSFDDTAPIAEIELPYNEEHLSVEEALHQIDWQYLKEIDKKTIITHRRIIHFDRVKDIFNEYLNRYGLKGKVFWFSFNPYENDSSIIFLNSLTNTYCEAYYLMVTMMMKRGISQEIVDLIPEQASLDCIDKHFLCMGGSERPHRTLALDMIEKKQLDGYVSRNFKGLDIKEYNFIWNQFVPEFIEFHKKAALNVVMESTANSTEIFITEKTYINYMVGRPFLTVGNRYAMKFLKKYFKFRSYPFLNEKYDEVNDVNERVRYVVEELQNFCSKPLDDVKILLQNNKRILDYNREVFTSLPHAKWFLQTINGVLNGR